MGCLLDDLGAFGISTAQWTTAAQVKGEWRKTVKQEAERFMAKWTNAPKARARLGHAVECSNATGRTKEMMPQNKRARVGSLAIVN